MRRLGLYFALTVALAACGASGGSTDDATSTPTPPATTEPTEATEATEPPSTRCESASAALVTAIESGLTVTGGGSLSNAVIVRSADFENVYFVAARIEGEGMDSTVGVWATNGPDADGLIFSADALAREFSEWGDGPGFSSSDDGFAEARDCASG